LFGTGSDVLLFSVRLIGKLSIQPGSQRLLAANGTEIEVLEEVSLRAHGGEHTFEIKGYVSSRVHDMILGMGFLKSQDALQSFKRAEIVLNGRRHKLHSQGKPGLVRPS
jgi:hypothetical protein